jgi:DNA-binding PadR family transcriptional regulator
MTDISNIEAAILGLLYENSHHGYELEKIIEERGMRNWTDIGFSSIYYVLKKLEDKELVDNELEKVSGKPSRKVYTITYQGKLMMQDKSRELLSENIKLISPFDTGVAYLDILTPIKSIEYLNNYLDSTEKRISFLENSVEMHQKINSPFNVVALFTRPLVMLKAEKTWINEFIEEIKAHMDQED